MPARYLIRIDDICPTMNWSVWELVEEILTEHEVRPLLAVVPDNRDPDLDINAPVADFWARVREWQARGWSIGLHGYQHLFTTEDAGLVGRNRYSEFAGLPRADQRAKLEAGSEIFRRNGVKPDAWIAPAHSFDATTLDLLPEIGIDCVSDGYALAPFTRQNMIWVPVQIGRFYRMPFGDWTVCLHLNSWDRLEVAAFAGHIAAFRSQIVSLDEMRATAGRRRYSLADRAFDIGMRTGRKIRA